VEPPHEHYLEQYRVSGAACVPAILDITDEHQAEIAKLQSQSVEQFCRQVLPAIKGDTELEQQIFETCPSLRPLPEPDKAALADLQKRADKAMAAAMAAHEELVEALRELDDLVREEAQTLAGTNMAGEGRIRQQAEWIKYELVNALRYEKQPDLKPKRARWE